LTAAAADIIGMMVKNGRSVVSAAATDTYVISDLPVKTVPHRHYRPNDLRPIVATLTSANWVG